MTFHLTSFHSLFPDVASRETRSITLTKPFDRAPPGVYGFTEFYCENPLCDCRNVIFRVFLLKGGDAVQVATINHALDQGGFSDLDERDTILEVFGRQSDIAGDILRLTEEVLLADPDYVARLERHYRMVKQRSTHRAGTRSSRRRHGARR